jgi:hypothetical protein
MCGMNEKHTPTPTEWELFPGAMVAEDERIG